MARVISILILTSIIVTITFLPQWSRSSHRVHDGRKVVEVWGWNTAAMSLDKLAEPFEAHHQDIDINITRNGTNMQSRLLLSLAANTGAPDITQLQQVETPRFIQTGRMLDLTAMAQKYAKEFPRSAWDNCVHDGKVFAIPWDVGPCAVFYKRSLFKKHGIDPDSIETWDDYIAAGKQLLERSGGKVQLLPLTGEDFSPQFLMMMQQNGGGVFDLQGRIILCSKQNIEVLTIMRKMLDAGICTPLRVFSPGYLASFKTEDVASYPIAVWMMVNIKDNSPERAGDWGVFRMPAFRPGGLRTTNLCGSTLTIPAQSARAAEAYAFVEYSLCTVEGQVAQYREFSLFPAYLPALRDPYFDEPDPFFAGQHVHRLFATDVEKIPPLVRTRDWNDAERILRETLSGWADKRMDHEAYLRDTQNLIASKFDREIAPAAERGVAR